LIGVSVQEINLYDLVKFYAQKWFYILICTYIGLSIGLVYNFFIQVPAYKSQASLLVTGTASGSEQQKVAINNYMQLLESRRVLQPVIEKLNLPYGYDALNDKISTSNQKDTEVIVINVTNGSPEQANKIATQVINSFKEQTKELYKAGQIQVIDGASAPNQPYNVRKGMQLLLFTAVGFLFAIISLFFMYDYRLSTAGKKSAVTNNTPKESLLTKFKNKRKASKLAGKKQEKENQATVNKQNESSTPERDTKTGRYVSGGKKSTKKAKNKRKS
jgi:capsular polysaccharide biosynthesis protein